MISVVIPAFNEEKVIGQCLESLKNQDYSGQYEIIVVDNGSKDNTAQIARHEGARIVLCSQKGVSYARQAGAEAANGEIIVQADADTIYPRGWLTRIKKQFNSHPKAVAITGTFIYQNPPWWAGIEYFLRVFFGSLTAFVFGRPLVISGANFAFYKRALLQIGGYEPNSYSSDQINLSTRLSNIGKVIFDSKSQVATSERSVTKPVLSIAVAFIQHMSYFAKYVLRALGPPLKKRSKKLTSVSTGTFLKVVVPMSVIGILCYGYFVPASPVFGKVYYRSITSNKVIALTLDDGPNEPYTSQILDILEKYDVPATFFLIGDNVNLYPDTARRILSDGDVIGNHTYYHNANHALTFNAYKDIQLAQQTIYKVTGVQPHLYRPPHGKKTPWELEAIKHEGFVEVLWNISTNELSGKTPEFMADDILKKARPGGIILLHDGYGTLHDAVKADKSNTVVMLSIIIPRLQAEGYTFVTIPELFNVPAYDRVAE